MIKIAIAGTSGLAQYIAYYISTLTSHQFIFLSRNDNPGLTAKGWQVIKVDYGDNNDLQYALTGIDTVISTISGQPEIALIDAAAQLHVRRFVPSEFEGSQSTRPAADILDRGNRRSLARLQGYAKYGMEYAVFACGIFYERFAPGGMASFQIGKSTRIDAEGDYLMNIRTMTTEIPYFNVMGDSWPTEFRVYGERMALSDVVNVVENVRGVQFEKLSLPTNPLKLLWHMRKLLATSWSNGAFTTFNVNPQKFRDWLHAAWSLAS
ncbi:hypothetical protein PAAG_04416 [Paracoccidioides lutzii Pb01]|uniref:NAD(P)-binding domain-containing protein n=1 Tax=Paracoccidioides lutzii (strain ATCC MYA-826 / Pb01) TaxID=502779 RepID=C1H0X2_PARBA|nr:hypothetical protein PAAG_04416 [Paracoccidioides lutzii Pb01]EEH33366.2 hypothetical protein PAAG_04416 [Paracoccidioides lutzii Pb01]